MTISGARPQASRKGGTESSRKFQYKSFSQQIANLKIDPVRRNRRNLEEQDGKSFFRKSLESWVELNLSATFSEFSRKALPLSESLPLILHNRDRIIELLLEYIDKRDALALEPLLDLLSQFAHDLGASFEPYFGRAITLLSSLVAQHVEVNTIEWTFNCLAYLFKYLSRLLVPDLRPLYDILAPLLGREAQKPFLTRFSAEALSFLVRKAKGEALLLFIIHAFEDLRSNASKATTGAYADGLMTMFYETCRSVDRSIHSRAPQIIEAMLSACVALSDYEGSSFEVLKGVLIAMIHHTTPETFQPILNVVYEFVETREPLNPSEAKRKKMSAQFLYTCITVRKGNRVIEWETVGKILWAMVDNISATPQQDDRMADAMWCVLEAVAVVTQSAPSQVVIANCDRTVQKIRNFQGGRLFVPFCELVAELDSERFRTFLLPYFQRFMKSHWAENQDVFCLLIPHLATSGSFQLAKDSETADLFNDNSAIMTSALEEFNDLYQLLLSPTIDSTLIEQHASICSRYLDIFLITLRSRSSHSLVDLAAHISKLVQQIFNKGNKKLAALAGKALEVIELVDEKRFAELSFSNFLAGFPNLCRSAPFLKGSLRYLLHMVGDEVKEEELKVLINPLIDNLMSPEEDARKHSLSCLELLVQKQENAEAILEPIRVSKVIEDIPLVVSNQRNISMYIRKLGSLYAQSSNNPWSARIVPAHCFGLLTIHFAPIWDDVVVSLAKIAETNEQIVADLAFSWLSYTQEEDTVQKQSADTQKPAPLTIFECSNMKSVDERSRKSREDVVQASDRLLSIFLDESKANCLSAATARSQALRVLCEVPQVAEKRSRILAPLFLEWAGSSFDDWEDEGDDTGAKIMPSKWSRRDQASMLTLISKFLNPKVLYKAELVYDSLLTLLKSGDSKIQSLALKCIITWKILGVNAYKDNLQNLLDDTRFRDELTHFVQVDEDESSVQGHHRDSLMPVLLRLLYGRSLSRKHASSGKKGMSSTRTTVLASLANFRPNERSMFVDIALGALTDANFVDKSNPELYKFNKDALGSIHFSPRKQTGFIRMTEDMLKQLGSTLLPDAAKLLDGVLYCLGMAQKTSDEEVDSMAGEDSSALRSIKAIRQGGLKCVNSLFTYCPNFSWRPYMPATFAMFISPRLDKLPAETSQSVSGLLQLFSTWSDSRQSALYLVDYNNQVLVKVAECLGSANVKKEVVQFVLQIIRKLVALTNVSEVTGAQHAEEVKQRVLAPYVDIFLSKVALLLETNPEKMLLEQCIETVALLAPHVSTNSETLRLVQLSVSWLNEPSNRVNPKVKGEILKILENFLPLCSLKPGDELFERAFEIVSSLFGYFKDRESRERLANVLAVLSTSDDALVEIGSLSQKLNAYSERRLDEPDFEQRLEAFAVINEEKYSTFSSRQWLPLLYNMLYFIRDNEELAIRTNASYSLKRFIEVCGATRPTDDENDFNSILTSKILPSLIAGARERSELVRLEYVGVVAHAVKECQTLKEISDLRPLLVGDDDEASFFNNILHIQQHRRLRALRRLTLFAKSGTVNSSIIAKFFLPLIEHFVFDQEDENAHNLANESVATIGALAEHLSWNQYKALLKRYIQLIVSRPELNKVVIRLVGIVVDALARALVLTSETAEAAFDGDGDVSMEDKLNGLLSETLPAQQKLAEDISSNFLPTLTEYLHQKDDSTVSLRVPVAVTIVKLLKLMPDDMLRVRLPGVLTDVCHILRSRAQESRDMTRKTLSTITAILGHQYFAFILKELRGALQRGYQLHVLSYTVHSILVTAVPTYSPGDLDYCAPMIVDIIMDDIFGVTGKEKDAEEYISKMVEVKNSKSYDSMDILASVTTLPYLGTLIKPIKNLLQENLTHKLVQKIDELFRRITIGLLRNENVKSRELLVFCYEVIQEVHKAESITKEDKVIDESTQRYIVNLKVPSKSAAKSATSSYIFKLTRFSLDLLRDVLRKHEQLMTPENVAGFVPVMGDAVLSKQEEVQMAALRLLRTVIRVPLASIDEGAGVFVAKSLAFIKSCPSMNAELAQASLKFITALLRERKDVPVKESTIAYLLTRIKADLDVPEQQGVTFNFLKAVMARKMVIPEVYDVLDTVAQIMVTNQTRSIRDLARGSYFHFLLDYPQGKGRLKQQLAFLVKNLEYPHEEGRLSVMDCILQLINKVGDNLVQEFVATFFVPLVMLLINDDSPRCREVAGELVKAIFKRADSERRQVFLGLCKTWVGQSQQLLVRAALQVFGLYLDVAGKGAKKEIDFLFSKLQAILTTVNPEDPENEVQWELIFFALQLWAKVVHHFPETACAPRSKELWDSVGACLGFPHAWIRLSAAQLLGRLFAEFVKSPLGDLPLENGQGMKLEAEELTGMAYAISSQLNSPELTEELGLQVVKNLLFLGRCFYENKQPAPVITKKDVELADEEEDEEDGSEPTTALSWIIGRISAVIRSERNVKKGLLDKKYALEWLAAIVKIISGDDLAPFAPKIIMPLYNLEQLPETHLLADLKTPAKEILSLLQGKMGTTQYANAFNAIRQQVQERRQERRYKRSIQLVADPEMAAKRKVKKQERKKTAKKEKAGVHREMRKGKRV